MKCGSVSTVGLTEDTYCVIKAMGQIRQQLKVDVGYFCLSEDPQP